MPPLTQPEVESQVEEVNLEGDEESRPEPEVIPLPESAKKPEEAAPAAKEGDPAGEASAEAAAAAPSPFTPTFKFKALDEEKEMEEWVRPFVTSKETEEKFAGLFSKVAAFDHVQKKRDEYLGQTQQLAAHMEQFQNEIREIRSLADEDFGAFMGACQIDPKKALQWFIQQAEQQELLNREDLPAWAKKMYTENQEQRARLRELENASRANATHAESVSISQREQELSQVLSRPEVASVASEFDARLKKPGAFAEAVKRHGYSEWHLSKGERDLSAEQAVMAVLDLLGRTPPQAPPAGATSSQPNAQATPAHKVITEAPKATVIPNVGSGTSTATVRKPKSLDDLREISRQASKAG